MPQNIVEPVRKPDPFTREDLTLASRWVFVLKRNGLGAASIALENMIEEVRWHRSQEKAAAKPRS